MTPATIPARPLCELPTAVIAGTASCRILVRGADDLYDERTDRKDKDVLHKVSQHGLDDTDLGTGGFAALDQDGELIGFFRRVER